MGSKLKEDMSKEIKFQDKNHHRTERENWSSLEWISEFYDFLRGKSPESIKTLPLGLSDDAAFTIIWYLQEHMRVLPDNIEKCDVCGDLYDSNREGYYNENSNEEGNFFFCNTHADEGYEDEEE